MNFSKETIMKWRRNAGQSWAMEAATPAPNGWSICPADPAQVVAAFSTLRLRPGLTLRAYQYRWGHDGHAMVFAMPDEAPLPAIDAQVEQPPHPPTALDDVMSAIDGDHTLESYMHASILWRELREFYAFGHGANWNLVHVLGQNIWSTPPLPSTSPTQSIPSGVPEMWTWNTPQPDDYRPRVEQKGQIVQVTFYTYSALGQEQIIRYEDKYDVGKYNFSTIEQPIAIGLQSYMI